MTFSELLCDTGGGEMVQAAVTSMGHFARSLAHSLTHSLNGSPTCHFLHRWSWRFAINFHLVGGVRNTPRAAKKDTVKKSFRK